jgi:hypothetical protein
VYCGKKTIKLSTILDTRAPPACCPVPLIPHTHTHTHIIMSSVPRSPNGHGTTKRKRQQISATPEHPHGSLLNSAHTDDSTGVDDVESLDSSRHVRRKLSCSTTVDDISTADTTASASATTTATATTTTTSGDTTTAIDDTHVPLSDTMKIDANTTSSAVDGSILSHNPVSLPHPPSTAPPQSSANGVHVDFDAISTNPTDNMQASGDVAGDATGDAAGTTASATASASSISAPSPSAAAASDLTENDVIDDTEYATSTTTPTAEKKKRRKRRHSRRLSVTPGRLHKKDRKRIGDAIKQKFDKNVTSTYPPPVDGFKSMF